MRRALPGYLARAAPVATFIVELTRDWPAFVVSVLSVISRLER
jgi:hypothetical protein